MTEGKLSSALVKRFQLKESIGKVLWHSLDKYGRIGEYDMQFGDIVLEGVDPKDVEPVLEQSHSHPKQTKKEKRKKK